MRKGTTNQSTGILLFALLFAMFGLDAASAATVEPVIPKEEDLRIFEVVLSSRTLGEALTGYTTPDGKTLLPFGELCRLLGLGIKVDTTNGRAEGFVVEERRSFRLDLRGNAVHFEGRSENLAAGSVELHADDLYVDTSLIARWLPIHLKVDSFAQQITITTTEKLPIEARLEREQQAQSSRAKRGVPNSSFPMQRNDYQLFSLPSVDQTIRVSSGTQGTSASYATLASADLLYLTTQLYLSGTTHDPFENHRFSVGRTSLNGDLLGVFRAREFTAGYVAFPGDGLLLSSHGPAPGLLVSNYPLNRATEFDRNSFRGPLPPSWDVELYQNGALIGYQSDARDGEYLFEDVPLYFGINVFRLIFYGPNGQRREELQRFFFGDTLASPGQFLYRAVAARDDDGIRRASLRGNYGISRKLSVALEASSISRKGLDDVAYGRGGLRGLFGVLFAHGDYVISSQGGAMADAGIETRLAGIGLSVTHTQTAGDFYSEVFGGSADALTMRDRARLDGVLPLGTARLPFTFEVVRTEYASGTSRTSVNNRLGAHFGGIFATNTLRWIQNAGDDPQFQGLLQLSRHRGRWGVRGELGYDLSSDAALLSQGKLTVENRIASGYRVFASVQRSFEQGGTSYAVGLSKSVGRFAALVNGRNSDSGTDLDVELSSGLGIDPQNGAFTASARSGANYGSASLRVFLDRNQNGVVDAGEEGIEGATFLLNGVPLHLKTDRSGVVRVAQLSPAANASIAVNATSLSDPQWKLQREGVRFTPRAGRTTPIEFPVVLTGEIDGTVYREQEGRRVPFSGAEVKLLSSTGETLRTVTAAYDGFYVIEGLVAGQYSIRVAPQGQLALQRLATISPQGDPLSGMDFISGKELGAPPDPRTIQVAQERPPISPPAMATAPPTEDSPVGSLTEDGSGTFHVQLGAFRVAAYANELLVRVRRANPQARMIQENGLRLVIVGPFASNAAAHDVAGALESKGFPTAVRSIGNAPVPAPPVASGMSAQPPSSRPYIVRIGSFRIISNADEAKHSASKVAQHVAVRRRGDLLLVEAGPFASRAEAGAIREQLHEAGLDAVVMHN